MTNMTKWIGAGVLLGVVALMVSLFAAGAGHGTNVPGYFLIPWAMMLLVAGSDNTTVVAAALAQYLICCGLVRYRSWLAVPILITHSAAVLTLLFYWGPEMARSIGAS